MVGRYSLDFDGPAYAGGEWNPDRYSAFQPCADNILPISDNGYFESDIASRLVEFVKAAFGDETLEENLKFIANALGGKGSPREAIRAYLLNGFYRDHCKTYKRRPIYWLFDSGKRNGFKALVYLHRYTADLPAKIRKDYLRGATGPLPNATSAHRKGSRRQTLGRG
jgi:type II restriction/modification system DNA methylase subunit YeeA